MKSGQNDPGGIIYTILTVFVAFFAISMFLIAFSQINMCPETQKQLEQCKSQLINITQCQEQLQAWYNQANILNTSYQKCLKNLETCYSDLAYCQKLNQTIIPSNVLSYNVILNNITISFIQFITIIVTPIAISFTLEVALFKVKFKERFEKIFTFFKMFFNLFSISVIISFLFNIPLLVLVIISGLFSWFYVYELKRKGEKVKSLIGKLRLSEK